MKYILSSLLFLFTLVVDAQKLSKEYKTTVGNGYGVVDARYKNYFYTGDNSAIAVKTTKKGVVVQKLNTIKLTETSKKVYLDFPKKFQFEKLIQFDDVIYYFYSIKNKKTKNFSLYQRAIDPKTGKMSASKELITTDRKIISAKSFASLFNAGIARLPGRVANRFLFKKSYDKSKVLISYELYPKVRSNKKNKSEYGVFVYDNKLVKVNGKEVTMPYVEAEMKVYGVSVKSDGSVYFFNKTKEKNELLKLDTKGAFTVIPLDLDGKDAIRNLHIIENEVGNLVLLGYYANGIEFKMDWTGASRLSYNTNGITYAEINDAGKVINKSKVEFPLDVIQQYRSDRQQNKDKKKEDKGKAGIEDLRIRKVTINDDGSIFILGEQMYTITKSSSNGSSTTQYFFFDLLAATISKDGKIIWMKKLAKRQVGSNRITGLGVKMTETADHHYFMFLDNVKNANIGIEDVPKKHAAGAGGYLTAYKVDKKTGEHTKLVFFDSRNINGKKIYQFEVTRIFDAEGQDIVLEIYAKKKQDKLIKMEPVK